MSERNCSVEGCTKPKHPSAGFGMCAMHYTRLRKHGSTDDPRPSREERFWAKVVKALPEGCWLWTGATIHNGYGVVGRGRRGSGNVLVHRYAYELANGPIPDGLHIDHLCRVRNCVNPDHLEAVTQAENNRRSWAARKKGA